MAWFSDAAERFLGKVFLECRLNLFILPLQSIGDQGNNAERLLEGGDGLCMHTEEDFPENNTLY